MKLLCITGMPGSGKSEAVKFFAEKGAPVVNMGDAVREEAAKRKLEIAPETLGKLSVELRKKFGGEEIARRCLKKIDAHLNKPLVIIDGLRSFEEARFFRQRYGEDFYILAVHASPKVRFERLRGRKRGDDPKSQEEFEARDARELGYGLGNVIALTDFLVLNEGSPKELKERMREVYERIRGE